MSQLADSKVQRSGVTAKTWNPETNSISYSISQGVRFRFSMASKGGGRTDVLFTVGDGDIPMLLKELAVAKPGLAVAFAEATQIAVAKSLGANN